MIDRTGPTGFYEGELEWTPATTMSLDPFAAPEQRAARADAPAMFTAVQEQLGLKLDPVKCTGGHVIDRIERPSEN